jgi:hypothetical protein
MYFSYIILLFVSHEIACYTSTCNTVFSNHFHSSKKLFFRSPDHVISMECSALNFRCQCTQQKLQSICAVLTFDLQHKKILAISVKEGYQLNYFICIKDLNAETITSLKLNWSFFICCCQHHEKNRYAFIYFWYQTDSGVPSTSIYSAVSLASPYYNYL